MLLALPCSLVTGQHGLHRGFVFLSCWVDLAQDEREAEEETATSPISALSRVDTGWAHRPAAGLAGQPGVLTEREGDPSGPLRDTWH